MLFSLTLLACSSSPSPGESEPLSAALLVYEENPRRKLWLFKEHQGSFVRQEPHIARDISSLGALVHDGELILTGICWWPGCGSEEEMKRRMERGPLVFGLATSDLQNWKPLQWRLNDPENYTPIDPQLHTGEEGLELWYFGAPGQAHRDPADRSVHAIRRAPLREDGRFHAAETVLAHPGLADPSPVQFAGEDWLFATQFAAERVLGFRGKPPQEELRFNGPSVPFAVEVRGELWLLATRMVNGMQQPVRAISTDGKQFGAFEAFLPIPPNTPCASPVAAVLNDTVVAFCVEEPVKPG